MIDVSTIAPGVPAPYADAVVERVRRRGEQKTGRIIGYVAYSEATGAAVAGEPSRSATLIRAQADGDLQTLRSHGLGAIGVHVSGPSDIEELS